MSKVFKIGITENNNKKVQDVNSIELVANKGIVGDRYFKDFSDPLSQLTLIESENIDYYNSKYNLNIDYLDFRRNIITKGIKLNDLVDKGNTVVVIEHNLDVVKCTDWIIDLGPEGGQGGGDIMAIGLPEEVIKVKKSYTGKFLKPILL